MGCAQTAARRRVRTHSVVAEESCYGMLIRIWVDMLPSTVDLGFVFGTSAWRSDADPPCKYIAMMCSVQY